MPLVADDEVPPAVGASPHGMHKMLAPRLESQENLRRSVRSVVSIFVAIANETRIAGAEQIAADEEHPWAPVPGPSANCLYESATPSWLASMRIRT